jgi:hypothetical protein
VARFVVDCSRFQVERPDPLDLVKAQSAGFSVVNIALDRGRGEDVLPDWAGAYADRARDLGIRVSTYRWLDSRLPGAESARRAYGRMRLLGGPAGMAHAVDVEDDASLPVVRDYCAEMQNLLGRPIALYSARWWWKPRGWAGSALTPYLWAAPNSGYLPGYPGDTSEHWVAGYGGWAELSAMQYAVAPLPGTGPCSLSAIRDPAVWAALTGGDRMTYQPQTWKDAQAYLHSVTGLPWDGLGLQHFVPGGGGYHEGNNLLAAAGRLDSDYSKRESERDRPGTDGSSAIDVGDFNIVHNGRRLRLVEDFNPWLIAQCKAGTPDTLWIREVIHTLDRKVVKRWDRLGIRSTGDSTHLYHTHISGFRDEENTPKTPLFKRFFEGDDMAGEVADLYAKTAAFRLEALTNGFDDVRAGDQAGEDVWLVRKLKTVADDVAELKSRPAGTVVLTPADKAELIAGFSAAAEAAVRKVLGAVDGAVPPATA